MNDHADTLRELIDRYRGQVDNRGEYSSDLFKRADAAIATTEQADED